MTTPKLAFNKRGFGRHYRHPITGVEVPSITNCIGVLDKPAIPRWAAKMVAQNAWQMRGSLDELGEQEAVDILKGSPWRKSGRAAGRGTDIHDYLEQAVGGRTVELDGDAVAYKQSADQFLADVLWEWLLTEFTVFGDGYAGTCDFLAEIGTEHEPRLVVGDYKTSKRLYPEIALQLAAVRFADVYVDPFDGAVHDMPQVDGAVGVLITPDGYEVREVQADEDAFRAFVACRDAWVWRNHGVALGEAIA